MQPHNPRLIRSVLAATLLALVAPLAQAQGTGSPPPPALQIEEIVVVAQKREESLQDVPVSITALTAQDLASSGIDGTLELGTVTPSLHIAQQAGAVISFIRGVGNNTATIGNEASVATYIDEVYFANASLAKFNNIAQVEVLKGPQGTLFGRNATGGLIHIRTRDPSHTPESRIKLGYADYEQLTASLYLTGHISDSTAADIAIYYRDQGKSFISNSHPGGGEHRPPQDLGLRSKWLIQPHDNLDIRLIAYYDRNEGNASMARHVRAGSLGRAGAGVDPDGDGPRPAAAFMSGPNFHDIPVDRGAFWDVERQGGSINLKYRFNDLELTSITAYSDDLTHFGLDVDGTPVDATYGDFKPASESLSQELRIASTANTALSWLAGLYYYDNQARNRSTRIIIGGNRTFFETINQQDTKSWAAYIDGKYQLSDQLGLTAGLRYSKDDLKARTRRQDFIRNPGFTADANQTDFDELTWRLVADYQLAADQLLYASLSTGYKSGTFNLTTSANLDEPAKAETLSAAELGYKSQLLDRRLQLNAALFYYDYKDIQVATAITTASGEVGTLISNAASAEISGFEVDGLLLINENIDLSLGLSLLDAEYDKYTEGFGRAANPPDENGNPRYVDPMNPSATPITTPNREIRGDFSGNALPRTPDYTIHAGLHWHLPTAHGRYDASATYYYNDGFAWEGDNRLLEDSYSLLNAELSWTSLNEATRLTLWGKNLTDAEYSVYTISNTAGGDLEAPAAPLTFGITGEFRF